MACPTVGQIGATPPGDLPDSTGSKRTEGSERVKISVRLPPHVIAWFTGLGQGNLTNGILRAYETAQNTRPSAPTQEHKDAEHARLAGELWPAWLHYTRNNPRLEHYERADWIAGRVERLTGRTPSPADIAGIEVQLHNLRRPT